MARCRWHLAILFALAVGVAPAPAQRLPVLRGLGTARPVDDARKDKSLLAFRDTLLAIVARRDSAGLAAHISPSVIYDFGVSDGGARGFFARWSQQMGDLWKTLDDVLRHGGRLEGTTFWAPWTMTAPLAGVDVEEAMVVRDSNVIVRERPDSLSRALGTLSYAVVRRAEGVWDHSWTTIGLPGGRVGFVRSSHIRSPMQWRLRLDGMGGRWVIALLLSGD